jgi:hypothetical protein
MSENGAPTGNVIDARAVFLARQMAVLDALAEESILGCWAKGMFLDPRHTAGQTDDRPCDTEARDGP